MGKSKKLTRKQAKKTKGGFGGALSYLRARAGTAESKPEMETFWNWTKENWDTRPKQ